MKLLSQNSASERRRFPRYPVHEEIAVRCAVNAPALSGSLDDLSYEGCLITLLDPVTAGLNDALELNLQTDTLSYRMMGFIRHLSPDRRAAGLQFLPPVGPDATRLKAFLSKLNETPAPSYDRSLDS